MEKYEGREMAQKTKIEWTDVSWNPVHGCSKVSTGCRNCYAETLSLRYGQTLAPWTARNAGQNVMLKPHKLREPLSKVGPWKNPCRVFVNSMSDLFHEQISDEYIAQVFAVMALAQQHTFQVLTKRPDRMKALLIDPMWWAKVGDVIYARDGDPALASALWSSHGNATWLANVWLGVSIENRKWVGRADVLRETPAAVRFISAEPLLGPLVYDEIRLVGDPGAGLLRWKDYAEVPQLDLVGIDWLIAGGESGPGCRSMDLEWACDLRDACAATGTAFFMKQIGGSKPGTAFEELPEDLRIREFPVVLAHG